MEKPYKTFYTVKYNVSWVNLENTAYFDDKKKALEFAKDDYTEKPVAHVLKKQHKIGRFKELVCETYNAFNLN